MNSYTPGPWKEYKGAIHPVLEHGGSGNDNYAICGEFYGPDAPLNRRLCIASPDLVEALLAALPYVEDVVSDPDQLKCFKPGVVQRDIKKIREALAKAGAQ